MVIRLRRKQFESVVDSIVKVFPSEEQAFYYQPSYTSNSGDKISARGILYEKYRTERKRAFLLGYIIKKSQDDSIPQDQSTYNIHFLTLQNNALRGISLFSNQSKYTFLDELDFQRNENAITFEVTGIILHYVTSKKYKNLFKLKVYFFGFDN